MTTVISWQREIWLLATSHIDPALLISQLLCWLVISDPEWMFASALSIFSPGPMPRHLDCSLCYYGKAPTFPGSQVAPYLSQDGGQVLVVPLIRSRETM